MSRPQRIVLLVGLPGSGKSTYLEKQGVTGLSSDTVRQLLADDPTDQTIHARVFATLRYLLRHRLLIGRPVTYIDATHLTPDERRPYIEIARTFDATSRRCFSMCRWRFAASAIGCGTGWYRRRRWRKWLLN